MININIHTKRTLGLDTNVNHIRIVDDDIRLIPYFPNEEVTLKWYQGIFVGDISLRNNGEIAIVICKEYQNRHIGRK